MARTTRSTPLPDPPLPPSATKKRPLSPNATSSSIYSSLPPNTFAPSTASTDLHPSKRSKLDPVDAPDASNSKLDGEAPLESGAALALPTSIGTSDTLPSSAATTSTQGTADEPDAKMSDGKDVQVEEQEREEKSALEGLSAEERKKAKGKGKATEENDADDEATTGRVNGGKEVEVETGTELEKLKKELAHKDSVRPPLPLPAVFFEVLTLP
jgi:hypothetical protein